MVEFTGAGTVTVAGIGPPSFSGIQTLRLINNTGNTLTLAHESGSATAAAWRIVTTSAADATIGSEVIALLVYSTTDSRWHYTTSGGLSGTGTNGRSTRFTGVSTVANGAWSDDGTNATSNGTTTLTGGATTLGDTRGNTATTSTSATIDNAAISASVRTWIVTPGAGIQVTGIANGAAARYLTVCNNSASQSMTFRNDNAGSTAANRFLTPDSADSWQLTQEGCISLIYDSAQSRWMFESWTSTTIPKFNVAGIFSVSSGTDNNTLGNSTGDLTTVNGGMVVYDGTGAVFSTDGIMRLNQATRIAEFPAETHLDGTNNTVNELAASGSVSLNGTSNAIGNSSTDTLAVNARLSDVGTLPAISTCASGTRTGGQWSFTVTPGSTTACTATFATACSSAPTCSLTPGFNTTAVHYLSAVSGSAITFNITGTGWSGSQTVHVLCICH